MIENDFNNQLISLINQIEIRPGAYLEKKSITLLHAYINGFIHCMGMYHSNFDNELFGYFSFWLGKKYDKSSTSGWSKLILDDEENEEAALDSFFIEFKEYIYEAKCWKTKAALLDFIKSKFTDLGKSENPNIYLSVRDYPTNYASEHYKKNYYIIDISYCTTQLNKNDRYVWKSIYIDKDLQEILVKSNKWNEYITIDEFINSEEYHAFTINDIPILL